MKLVTKLLLTALASLGVLPAIVAGFVIAGCLVPWVLLVGIAQRSLAWCKACGLCGLCVHRLEACAGEPWARLKYRALASAVLMMVATCPVHSVAVCLSVASLLVMAFVCTVLLMLQLVLLSYMCSWELLRPLTFLLSAPRKALPYFGCALLLRSMHLVQRGGYMLHIVNSPLKIVLLIRVLLSPWHAHACVYGDVLACVVAPWVCCVPMHLGACCPVVSVALVFAFSAGCASWPLVRLLCLAELFSPTFGDDDASYAREGADPSPTNAGAASSSQPLLTVVRKGKDLQPLEGYLRLLHGEGNGYKAMASRLRQDHSLDCSEQILRTWIKREKAHPGEAHWEVANAAPTKIRSVDDLRPLETYLRQLHVEGKGRKAMASRLRTDHSIECGERILRTWVKRDQAPHSEAHLEVAPAAPNDFRGVDDLRPVDTYLRLLHAQGKGYRAMASRLRVEHGWNCPPDLLKQWVAREALTPPGLSSLWSLISRRRQVRTSSSSQ